MDAFAKLATGDRKTYFDETANRRNTTSTAIEKDFWVCWCLKRLFELRDVPELRFKGGTSLSKVFGLIHRFSEDIDISLNRAALGFVGDRDMANPTLSGNKRRHIDEELRAAIEKNVKETILPRLQAGCGAILGTKGWSLVASAEANEEMTLLFNYPVAVKYEAYLRPQIKIEFGRGDQEPSERHPITSYVAEEFPDVFVTPDVEFAVLDCERTFWEKVTLLHAENHRPDPSKLKPRMSRHWSDVAVMSTDGHFADEKLDVNLLRRVIEFKKIYFASSWAHYETAVPGTLSVVPNEALAKVLREDYRQMREMFWDTPVSFDEVLAKLKTLEDRINSLK
jgi:predicted nucleotidyltransferase component of viral defense system